MLPYSPVCLYFCLDLTHKYNVWFINIRISALYISFSFFFCNLDLPACWLIEADAVWLICPLYWQTVHCKCKTQKVNSYKLTHARCTNILLYTEQHTYIIYTHAHTHKGAQACAYSHYITVLLYITVGCSDYMSSYTYNSIVGKQKGRLQLITELFFFYQEKTIYITYILRSMASNRK